jgi:hypothetical protein
MKTCQISGLMVFLPINLLEMENILLKYNKLDQLSQQLVDDFIEMLANRQQAKVKKGKKQAQAPKPSEKADGAQPVFDYQAYKKQLLSLPPWTSEEVRIFDQNLGLFKNMKLDEW